MGKLSPAERSIAGRLGAYVVHPQYGGLEVTAAARAAFRLKFEREVNPEGDLSEAERLRRAEMARKAHFA